MELTKETRDRIYAAADALFEQNGRDAFPTVDAVRKAARVNMNDASSGMKEWRRAQTAQAAPVAVRVPEAVSAAGGPAVAGLWPPDPELGDRWRRAGPARRGGRRAGPRPQSGFRGLFRLSRGGRRSVHRRAPARPGNRGYLRRSPGR